MLRGTKVESWKKENGKRGRFLYSKKTTVSGFRAASSFRPSCRVRTQLQVQELALMSMNYMYIYDPVQNFTIIRHWRQNQREQEDWRERLEELEEKSGLSGDG